MFLTTRARLRAHCFPVLFALFLSALTPPTAWSHGSSCQSVFDVDRELTVSDFTRREHNVFSDSLPSTLASGLIWLSLVQLARTSGSGLEPAAFLTPAFRLTVPIDVTLTGISHAIALWPWLHRLTSGKAFGPKFEFAARASANTLMGTSVITLSWLISGINVTPTHCAAAAGLCGAVYPTLQVVKNQLFRSGPKAFDRKQLEELKRRLPGELDPLLASVRARARELEIPEEVSEAALLEAIDALALSIPYEDRVLGDVRFVTAPKNLKLIEEIQIAKSNLTELASIEQLDSKVTRLKALRRKLVHAVLQEHSAREKVLSLGGALSAEASLALHLLLDERARTHKWRLRAGSFLDQMVSIGVAGGVFLYSVNHWAHTGEIPWYWP